MESEFVTELRKLSNEELESIKSDINNVLKSRVSTKSTYTHDCFGGSCYHFTKYKHYAKQLTRIDDTENSGYAFIGKFLNVQKEDVVEDGSYIVEVCKENYTLYKMNNGSKEELHKGKHTKLVSFINECKKITGM